jgi:hypothetical protein
VLLMPWRRSVDTATAWRDFYQAAEVTWAFWGTTRAFTLSSAASSLQATNRIGDTVDLGLDVWLDSSSS